MTEPIRQSGKAAELLSRAMTDLEAAGAAVARRQSSAREPLQEYAARMRELLRLARQVTSILELRPLLETLMDAFVSMTGAERGFLMLCDPQGKLEFEAARNLETAALEGEESEISRGVVRDVAQSGQSLFVEDVLAHGEYGVRESVVALRLRSLSCVPLVHGGRVVGLCYTDSTRPGRGTSEAERALLEGFASQAAVAIDNARRHAEVLEAKSRLEAENEALRRQIEHQHRFGSILGESEVMQPLFALLERVSATSANVLLQGETGTGKELVARAIHCNGTRRDRPWISVNCGALPELLLESELFGHRKGSFTGATEDHRGLFEAADGGTLFLDEVGDMSAPLQAKLLRALQRQNQGEIRRVGDTQSRSVDVRVIAATHRDLAVETREGRFREDLFYRLNVIGIRVPPLRERGNDVLLLANEFTRRFATQNRKNVTGLAPAAARWLLEQRWSGNIRELENCIERAVTLCEDGASIGMDLLPAPLVVPSAPRGGGATLRETLDAVERDEVRLALQSSGGRVSLAAKRLGVSRQHLHNLLKKHDLRIARAASNVN